MTDFASCGIRDDESRWSPQRFIEQRVFCPLSEIQDLLDLHRRRCQATELVLVSVDQAVALRTLTLVSHDKTIHSRGLVQALHDPPDTIRRRRLDTNPWWSVIRDDDDLEAVLRAAKDHAESYPSLGIRFHRIAGDMQREEPWRLVAPFQPDDKLTVNCILLRRGGRHTSGDAAVLSSLVMRVNATANASVHRDSRVMRAAEASLRRIGAEATDNGPVRELLDMARAVSRSSAAALYVYDRALGQNAPKLTSYGEESVDPALQLRLRLRSSALSRPRSGERDVVLASAAFDRGRPLLYQAGSSWPGEYTSTWMLDASAVSSEIALPMPAAAGGGTTPTAGVLVLCKARSEDGHYGDYDLAILRNVALRIALLQSALMVDEASDGVIRTSQALTHSESPALATAVTDEALPLVRRSQRRRTSTLPIDYARAMPAAAPIIDFVARATGSHSATLRLLVQQPEQRLGKFVLHRVVSWPEWRTDEDYEDLDPNDDSTVNSWVAKHGQPVYIPNALDAASFSPYRGLTKIAEVEGRRTLSELCVPVHVDGRLVGTVNLESPARDSYGLLENLVSACGSLIGLTIASIRREYSRDVLSIGSDVQSGAHELAGLRGRLIQRAGKTSSPSSFEEVVSVLDKVIGSLRPVADEYIDSATISDTAIDIVERAADAARVDVRHRNSRGTEVQWRERFARRFYLAMFEVFSNIREYGLLNEQGLPTVYVGQSLVGGREYLEVVVTHRNRPNREPDPTKLHRAPMQREDRLHFGAYTATAIIRTLGGDINVLRLDRSGELAVVVSVPVREPSVNSERTEA